MIDYIKKTHTTIFTGAKHKTTNGISGCYGYHETCPVEYVEEHGGKIMQSTRNGSTSDNFMAPKSNKITFQWLGSRYGR